MTNFLLRAVFSILLLPLKTTSAFPPSGLDYGSSRSQRDVPCRAELEYRHNHICCLNCPAGTRVKLHCTSDGERSQCEDCDYGTYTEHANELPQCFKCTQCRSDQEVARHCTTTQDTQCRCKPGWFCAPDQACEVCKRCSKCEKDEAIVRNCTSTTNTECKKIQSDTDSNSTNAVVVVPVVLLVLVLLSVIAIVVAVRKRRRTETDSQRSSSAEIKAGQSYRDSCSSGERRESQRPGWTLVRAKSSANTKDECKVLCESLNSSASNSQHSLTNLYSHASPAPLPPAMQPTRTEEREFPRLIPLNGEVSLKKCFEYFEEVDISYHKRFFRNLGIADNLIKSRENLPYEDRIHELLNIWVEKEGRDASMNDLLRALLELNQRRSAETIVESALHNGHYVCES